MDYNLPLHGETATKLRRLFDAELPAFSSDTAENGQSYPDAIERLEQLLSEYRDNT